MASASQWAHLGYLSACEAALRAYGVETAATEADADPVRTGAIEALVVGARGYIEPLDLGWTEEYGWGYSRKVYPDGVSGPPGTWGTDRPETYAHGQFGGGVLPEPEHFAHLVVRIAAGEELEDHIPGEPRAYRTAGAADGLVARLLAFGPG